MADVTLSRDGDIVTFLEAEEARAQCRTPLDLQFDVTGAPVVYTEQDQLELMAVKGRLASLAEVQQIEAWRDSQETLTLTDRAGTTDGGWRIHTDPARDLRRKDGDSADWICVLALWRLA
jgi:hypothetical protein